MFKFPIAAGIFATAALSWAVFAQDVPVPRAEPVDPTVLREKDVPRALPIERDEIPRAKPVTAVELEEIERLRREREAERLRNDEEALRLKQERERKRLETERERVANGEPAIPRALPIGKLPGDPLPEEPAEEPERLSPLEVAAQRAPELPERPENEASKIKASWETRADARSFTMLVPAPRGQIVDRFGQPLVHTKVANKLAIKFPQQEGAPESEVLRYARQRIELANRTLGQSWAESDEAILTHFKNRRWLPMMFSSTLSEAQQEAIIPRLDSGLILFPVYLRHYPENALAAHILGYVGTVRDLPTRAVASGDALFEEIEGRDGLEVSFDADLQGSPGLINYLFDSDGTELAREITRNPIPGATVVTTLDLEMQRLAEEILAGGVKRGAFVVMNVRTGEILTMASYPSFDPNDFSPRISQKRFDELNNNPDLPLFARAFRGTYPPASTFKVATALAALESGAITEHTELPCPRVMIIDKRPFHNWNKKDENNMNVIVAIGRSCNPFFFRAALRAGGESVSSMGYRLGLGQKTGIPLVGEQPGFMPNESNMRERGKNMSGGHLANVSIGQGELLATPLQVCQMMAAIANGIAVPEARLVMQVQDSNNRVIKDFPPQEKNVLNISKSSLDTVRSGMAKVVNASWGTGRSAGNDYVTLAGKTGTAQWTEDRNLAWFAGFVPYEDPEYAFAVLYEGDPGETVGGGRVAGPLAGKFFNSVYSKKNANGELADYKRESSGDSSPRSSSSSSSGSGVAATPAAEPVAVPDEETEEKKRTGFFKRFNRGR